MIVMKILLLLALAASVSAPARAEDFFGINSEDAQALIGEVKAAQHLQRLQELGWSQRRFPSVGKVLGYTKTLSSAQNCVLDAVEAHLGVTQLQPNTEFPDVLYQSEVDSARYRAAVKAQYPTLAATGEFVSIYLPDFDVIYLADSASAYSKSGSIDGALAGQYARFLDRTQRNVGDQAKIDADAAEARSWYDATYPAGTSSCR
jgi:hypothetical protein